MQSKNEKGSEPPATQTLVAFKSADDFKKMIATNYMAQIGNLLGDKRSALRFLSGMMAAVQRNEDLLECTPISLINSFIVMAELGLMPNGFGGEAYVLPYWNSKKDGNQWVKVREAQFQLGYQGYVTLFYRAGIRKIIGELVRENDQFEMVTGEIVHVVDPFKPRGARKGAYVIITLANGETMQKVMSADEILDIAKKFSKSFASSKSPWDEASDPQGWMWVKTVLRQIAKLVPKNDKIMRAIAEDDKDSVIEDVGKPSETQQRLENAEDSMKSLTTGAVLKKPDAEKNDDQGESKETGEQPAPEDEIGRDIKL